LVLGTTGGPADARVPEVSGPVPAYPTQVDVAREEGRLARELGDVTPDDPDLRGLFLGIRSALDRAES
jgi:hypothetical protein